MSLKEKVAIVAGGGQNLGEHISYRLAREGYGVAVTDINEENAVSVASDIEKETDQNVIGFKVDVTDEESVSEMVTRVKEEFGRIDLLVFNAGVAKSTKITNFELNDWKIMVDVNLTGYFLCAREVSKVMIDQGEGSIIQINSKSGKVGSKHNAGYSSSKFGGVGLTQSLALDLAEHGVRVNSIMPGNLLKSPMFQSLIPSYAKKLNISEDEVEQVYIDKVPMKRGCTYEDVANAIVFYASDQASYMTGQSINVTGGQVMH
ncbi:sorbitol-6-phosphate dehydrogenase [Alteribacillus bidgolensis]|uniref:Sorbitol-6-phosphate 2-dehydrogenase n=1 Tax=Alteribacillus bidgolensis TaxID=930129 RepID=A0A1G8KYX1_9BACI|nr:sorbitol-6-phosphate dehydrogenase [Alteribacillus bidgolensis]SDI48589.1 sorbitol-6-phosphate 2-dehydrogenase [Alteribacillus bidgolensis]